MASENIKGVRAIQDLILKGKSEIKKSELEKLGFDLSKKEFEIRNVKVKKDFLFDMYYLSVIDKQKCLDGTELHKHKKLASLVSGLWETGKKQITVSELAELNIIPPSEIKIGNIAIRKYILTTYCEISLIDREKDIDGKWIDSAVTMDRVLKTLVDFPYNKKMLELNEVPLNKELEKYFKEYFQSVKKSDTSNKGLIDLSIGNDKNKIAIELKLSRKVKQSSESQKCRGQIGDYKKQFGSNLVLVIAGEEDDKQEKYVQECINKAKELGIKSLFMKVKS